MVNKRDMVLGVVFGVAGLVFTWWLGDTVADAATAAGSGADGSRDLMVLVGLGLAVLALGNIAAMRARVRRNRHDDQY